MAETTATRVTTTTPTPATPTPRPETYGISDDVVLAVSYALEGQGETEPPAGQKRVVVVASVQNRGEQPLTITRESLTLIGSEGTRFSPEEPDENTEPPLVGTTLEPGEDLLGLAAFIVPEEVTAAELELCPGGPAPCDLPLTAPIP
jgi:hypothetical protein